MHQTEAKSVTSGSDGKQPGSGFTRASKVSLFSIDETPSELSSPKPKQGAKKTVPPDPQKLAAFQARDEIASVIWDELGPRLAGMTRNGWMHVNGNRAVLLDMAKAAVTPIVALGAWRELCDARGEAIYKMRWVQEWIARGGLDARNRRLKKGCDCDLPIEECLQLHNDPNDVFETVTATQALRGK